MDKSKYYDYAVKRQGDGSFAVIEKDLLTGKLDIVSVHDTMDEAKAEIEDFLSKPSQAETLKMMGQFYNALDKI